MGNSWEWRYRVRGIMHQETFSVSEFPTESTLWQHLEPAISRLNMGDSKPLPAVPTMEDLAKRYMEEYLPKLSKSTCDTDRSMISVHILPRWKNTKLVNVRPADVETWIESLPLSAASRGRARRTMKQMIDRAMVWGMLPLAINPMTLVKVRGSSKREKKPAVLTPDQVNALMQALPKPYNLMVLIAAGLGLRVSEVVALKWQDFDWHAKSVSIRRAYTHGSLKEAKTEASAATLPVAMNLIKTLKAYRKNHPDDEWLFPSPVTGRPFSPDTILSKIIKPKARDLKLPNIGWHTFRHSYRSWLGGTNAKLAQMKDMMRHGDISTTMDYGRAQVDELRPFQNEVAGRLKVKRP